MGELRHIDKSLLQRNCCYLPCLTLHWKGLDTLGNEFSKWQLGVGIVQANDAFLLPLLQKAAQKFHFQVRWNQRRQQGTNALHGFQYH